MHDPDALLLARIQFGFTISFHIVFPALTIGMASYLAVLEGCWLRTRREVYLDLYHFWLKVFSVAFGMGVVSGLVMAYQFGTNWSGFSRFAGGITGPLLAYEVLTAFFLEAGFLGVMLFGLDRVGPALHFLSTIMVALGTLLSATWILASNSWLQTPQGHAIIEGRAVPVHWLEVIFNPSFPYRLGHMVVAAYLATALVVAASAAWHLLHRRDTAPVRTMFSMAMGMVVVAAPIQAFIGDAHGRNTLAYQPAKVAAIEAHWENVPGRSVPLVLFAWPDMRDEANHLAVEVPYLGSLVLTHDLHKQIPALKDFPRKDRPNATIVFWTFRVMVGLGVLMIALGVVGLVQRVRDRLYTSKALHRWALAMGPAGLLAIIAGWVTTEAGRQPWVVYGVLRTADAVSLHGVAQLGFTLALFVVVYLAVFGAGTAYLVRIIGVGPVDPESRHAQPGGPGQSRQPMRPLSAVVEGVDAAADQANRPVGASA